VGALRQLLVPPICATCGGRCAAGEPLCRACRDLLAAEGPLAGAGPPGLDRAWSSAPHQGVARELVMGLKFRRLLPLAALMAERIEALAPAALLSGELVPVPSAPFRTLLRGFDPAAEIAAALAARTGLGLRGDCLRRRDGGRQLGRPRARRIGDAPRLRADGPAPASVLLVDDVLTTGATVSSAARALRAAGARRVVAITFSRRP
jgi:predicted amidophosphoribosyltransferase